MIEAYPLSWPSTYPRTQYPKAATKFQFSSLSKVRDGLLDELRLLRATDVVLSTNIPLRKDGLPYADYERRHIRDYGVAVYFKLKGKPMVLACDTWNRIEDNMHAIELTIGAMRGLDRWGVSQMLERAFTGFTALPSPSSGWREVLQAKSLSEAEQNFKEKIKRAHPDLGGSHEQAAKLNQALQEARQELR